MITYTVFQPNQPHQLPQVHYPISSFHFSYNLSPSQKAFSLSLCTMTEPTSYDEANKQVLEGSYESRIESLGKEWDNWHLHHFVKENIA